MSVRAHILSFLRDDPAARQPAGDPQTWRAALDNFAVPMLEAAGDYPLRPAQVAAWRGLAPDRAGLVLGPPGTGKTHMLAWLIVGYMAARRAEDLPTRVFVSAFTRNAIGNLLDAVADLAKRHLTDVPVAFYLGGSPPAGLSANVVHRERVDGAEGRAVLAALGGDLVVAGTTIWTLQKLMRLREAGGDGFAAELFDLVCIDEASQLVLGHGLMAMAGLKPSGRLIVAGDDRQLPPIRAGREVKMGNVEIGGSLYGFMKSAAFPEFALDETFRLNGPLAAFPERKFYAGRFTSAVGERRLDLIQEWRQGLSAWQSIMLDPDWPVVVLLYEGRTAATSNPFEAALVAEACHLLADRFDAERTQEGLAADLWRRHLAVISLHRAQNSLIRKALPKALRDDAFVETVDRIQGKERDAVVLSYCVADPEFALAEADFIFSSERLNVAVTRARSKLIMIISRRLLDAAPSDQDQMDKAEVLREFVFSTTPAAVFEGNDDGRATKVELRVAGFAGLVPEAVQEAPASAAEDTSTALTSDLEALAAAIRAVALESNFGTATVEPVERRLARKGGLLPGFAKLQVAGLIRMESRTGPRGAFLVARPLDPPQPPYAVDAATVSERLEEVIRQTRRGSFAPYYMNVRHRFAWMDAQGADALLPQVDRLVDEGRVVRDTGPHGLTLDWREREEAPPEDETVEAEMPSEADFAVLNALEDLEAARINFGVFEAWTSAASLADRQGMSRERVTGALGRLAADGWVMLAEQGRVRSRMAELAREIRYVKQRFRREDASERPYLVRSLKLVLRDRDKPAQSEPLSGAFARSAETLPEAGKAALSGLAAALRDLWGPQAKLAGFQARSLQVLSKAWFEAARGSYVIAADTGSGKTEAACLPLIAAAAADRVAGIKGVRAVLAYPRVRLATNQAQRLARYLAALALQPNMPTLTLGLQIAAVPRRFDSLDEREVAAGWRSLGSKRFSFPFFACPTCACDLMLEADGGVDAADRLSCTQCDWTFTGWVGSKSKLMSDPPAFFLPTTDSLHQWMHDERYGRLFGDDSSFAPPRAVLADEIHLYAHHHGAQVGLTLRRLAARAEINGRPMLTIGMSATLGDPREAWSRLAGRPSEPVLGPTTDERIVRPKGREYFFFVQPEIESRGRDIAGASTTIQTLMCLTHGMRRRTGRAGGFRSLVFLDSIDKVRRLHAAYHDAEAVQRLAAYRTRHYPPDPASGAARDGCCGEPHGCDAFRDGECWYFAATDVAQRGAPGRKRPGAPLTVAEQPVSSETSGRVEALIKTSDVIFATSSLEVGYDDPDITMVYQHYAPQNLASFIQRKGRGGRDAEDRPTTGVTLSLYSSRDSFWFRRPEEMVSPSDFDTPLNPDNYFVRRGQILASVLDGLARFQRQRGVKVDPVRPPAEAWRDVEAFVSSIFGPASWRDYGQETLAGFWTQALGRSGSSPRFLNEVRPAVDWLPDLLFDAVTLPRVRVAAGGGTRQEDVALALANAAPGNASRRSHPVDVFWRPPVEGLAPWFADADYADQGRGWHKPFGEDASAWLSRLPDIARPALEGLSTRYFRPTMVTLEALGRAHGIGWQSDWIVADDADTGTSVVVRADGAGSPHRRVRHESTGRLRGFPIVKTNPALARVAASQRALPLLERIEHFTAVGAASRETGLALARVYWGADANVRMGEQKVEDVTFTQMFCAPGSRQPLLHGYHVQTEGIRVVLDEARLTAFVASEAHRLEADDAWRRWHAGQMMRFRVEEHAQALGVSSYDTQRAADLIVSAAAVPDLRRDLNHLLRFWSGEGVAEVFEATRARLLSQHPLLTQERVARVAGRFADPTFQALFQDAIRAPTRPESFSRYLKSVIVHALAVRLREAFLQIGRGDERQVVMHVPLPLQFADAQKSEITICEASAYGDGTTRSFLERIEAFADCWHDGFLTDCPNARDDAALETFFAYRERHAAWRGLDPNGIGALRSLAGDLGLQAGTPVPPTLLRILFGSEGIGVERFDLYDIAMALRAVDARMTATFERPPSPWELTSAAVEDARAHPETVPGRLLAAYAGIEDASLQESLSPESRFADQVFRLHSRLCVDGCQACVHQSSDMMSDTMVEASTSRRLLTRYLASA